MTKLFNTNPTENTIKKNETILPLFLRPKKGADLIRIGRDYDGGYLVDKRSVNSSDFLLSFGIYDDWSFEKSFKSIVDVPVIAFDSSVGQSFFLKKLRVALSRGSRKSLYWLRVWVNYLRFFKGRNKHIKKRIGKDEKEHHVSVSTIAKEVVPSKIKNIFFKIDIEGSEYQILDQLVAISDRITGLVIEFHEVDIQIKRIESFVRKFPLSLCHIHCNNYAPLNESSTPPAIEATFTKYSLENNYIENLPNSRDQPNKKGEDDYSISFCNF